MKAELVIDGRSTLGEGPFWHGEHRLLYWVDILGQTLQSYEPRSGRHRSVGVGEDVGAAVARESGGFILALRSGFAAFDPESGETSHIHDPEPDRPGNRFNDGKCDLEGRFWAGTMAYDMKSGSGALYCLERDLTVRRVLEGVTISNGLAWSLDGGTFYYIDTAKRHVQAFDYDGASGRLARPRTAFEIEASLGYPDGMTIDEEGNLWIALWGGARVGCWDPRSGKLLETVQVAAEHVSSCAFGGDELNELYITTAREGLDRDQLKGQPHAGGLFRVRPGVRGFAAAPFRG